MMVIKHMAVAPAHARDVIGARQDILIWEYGVVTGHVAAVQVLTDGSADLVIEFDEPQPTVVPDDLCERLGRCRLDRVCPYFEPCWEHYRDCTDGDCCNP